MFPTRKSKMNIKYTLYSDHKNLEIFFTDKNFLIINSKYNKTLKNMFQL